MARLFFNKTELQLWRDTLIAQLQHLHQPFKIFLTLLLAITIPNMASADTRCENPAAILESAEGAVEWAAGDNDTWQKAERGASFCYGDKVRVVEQRAALRLANETLVRLQENSLITLLPEEKGFWFGLIEGAGHFLSRTPKQFTIKAPYLNAAVDGTEFVVIAQPQENRVAVVEGAVRVNNDFGEVHLSEGTQTSAAANSPPSAVQSIRLRDAAEWVLYYPPLIVQISAPAQIETLIQQENYAEALAQLTAAELTPETAALAASLAYHIGNTSQGEELLTRILHKSPNQAEALALQALRTLINGDSEDALAQTTQLISTHPKKPSVLLAHAYAQQSHGNIEEALKTNLQAQALIPDNLFVLARTAELQLSVGNTRAAQKLINKALSQAPQHSRLNTLAGFIALNRFATSKAQNHFQAAITSNSNEPLARLGLALALIQKGKINEGRAQMEMAVLLDPTSSLLRSYLGKTYATQNQNDWADTQYQLAKNLDPNDPTPWFYQAHLKHEENKPGEALRLITTAIEKNDNRAVYRSRMLLDSDAAARSVNMAQIFQSMGINDKVRNIASIAVVENPLDFSSHKALATTLESETDLSSKVVRTNETLIAKLLMPIGAEEFSVASNITSTFEPAWVSPSRMGAHDYTPLFSARGLKGEFLSFLGSQDSKGHEWQLKAISQNAMMSGGQYVYKSSGYRKNNDFSTEITEANLHWNAFSSAKIFAQFNGRNEATGDVLYNADSNLFDESYRSSNDENTIQFGGSINTSNNTRLLFNADRTDSEYSQNFLNSLFDTRLDNFQATLIGKASKFTYQIGFHEEKYRRNETQDLPVESERPWQNDRSNTLRAYSQLYFHTLENLTLFASANHMDRTWELPYAKRSEGSDSYKSGLNWKKSENLSITAAYWTDDNPRYAKYGTVENSQIFDISTKDFLFAFTDSENKALSINYSNGSFHLNLQSINSKLKPWAYLFDTERDPIWSEIQNFYYKRTTNYGSISKISDSISFYFKWRQLNQERMVETYRWNEPLEYRFHSNFIGATYFINSNLIFDFNIENIYQRIIFDGFDHHELYNFPKDGTIISFYATYKFHRPSLSFSLDLINITDREISILERPLGTPDDYFSPLTASHFIYPSERTILLTSKFKF